MPGARCKVQGDGSRRSLVYFYVRRIGRAFALGVQASSFSSMDKLLQLLHSPTCWEARGRPCCEDTRWSLPDGRLVGQSCFQAGGVPLSRPADSSLLEAGWVRSQI